MVDKEKNGASKNVTPKYYKIIIKDQAGNSKTYTNEKEVNLTVNPPWKCGTGITENTTCHD